MLDQVVTALTWSEDSGLAGDVYAGFVERLASAFGGVLSRTETSGRDDVAALRALIRKCPDDSFLRLLTAPELFARLAAGTAGDDAVLSFARESMFAEWCRSVGADPGTGPLVTALGEYRWFDGRLVEAPCIEGIPVDFDSPYAVTADIPVDGSIAPLDDSTRADILRGLTTAMAGLAASPSAIALVHLFTRVIVVRRDHDHEAFLSSSSPRYVGRTVLCNPDRVSVEVLADALVHEAIHALLCGVQLQHPFVVDHGRLASRDVTSPWTGRVLPMDAYLEACFVWFGLWHLWRQPAVNDRFGAQPAAALRTRSQAGFAGIGLSEVLRDAAGLALTVEAVESVAAMQAIVVRECRA